MPGLVRVSLTTALVVAGVGLFSSCGGILGIDDLVFDLAGTGGAGGEGGMVTSSGGGSTGGAGGAGGFGGVAGGGGSTGGAGGFGGATGGAGGIAGGLVDATLVARYFMDEAASGKVPLKLKDSSPSPVDLNIHYEGQAHWTSHPSGRGLELDVVSSNAGAWASTNANKLAIAIDGTTTATIEVVAELHDVDAADSRLVHFGSANTSFFCLESETIGSVQLDKTGGDGHAFKFMVDHLTLGRAVYHLVYDSSHVMLKERVKLYVNGLKYSGTPSVAVQQNETIDLPVPGYLAIGNRPSGSRSIDGVIYYVAIYSGALTKAQVQHNAMVLVLDDDGP